MNIEEYLFNKNPKDIIIEDYFEFEKISAFKSFLVTVCLFFAAYHNGGLTMSLMQEKVGKWQLIKINVNSKIGYLGNVIDITQEQRNEILNYIDNAAKREIFAMSEWIKKDQKLIHKQSIDSILSESKENVEEDNMPIIIYMDLWRNSLEATINSTRFIIEIIFGILTIIMCSISLLVNNITIIYIAFLIAGLSLMILSAKTINFFRVLNYVYSMYPKIKNYRIRNVYLGVFHGIWSLMILLISFIGIVNIFQNSVEKTSGGVLIFAFYLGLVYSVAWGIKYLPFTLKVLKRK